MQPAACGDAAATEDGGDLGGERLSHSDSSSTSRSTADSACSASRTSTGSEPGAGAAVGVASSANRSQRAVRRRLTNHPASDQVPVFSPDGTRIAFQSARDGNQEIYIMTADGSGAPTNLSNNPALDSLPEFSPTARA